MALMTGVIFSAADVHLRARQERDESRETALKDWMRPQVSEASKVQHDRTAVHRLFFRSG